MLTSFLLSHLQTAHTAITTTLNVTAPPAKTTATANEVIVGTGTERGTGTGTGKETGIVGVGGEKERTATATLTATAIVQTAAAAAATATVAVTAKKDAPATRKNAGENSHVKTTDAAHSAAMTKEVPLAAPAAAVAANATVAHQNAARQHRWAPSRCRSASARPVAGTFMRQVMSSTRLCKRNKPVRNTYLLERDV